MERLPQELINNVVQYLERSTDVRQSYIPIHLQVLTRGSKLPPYATISRRWKAAIESIAFRKLRITNDDLGRLEDIVTGERRQYLSRLHFMIYLPEYAESAFGCRESEEDRRANNHSFTGSISALFSVLKRWEGDGVRNSLELRITSPSCQSDSDLERLKVKQKMAAEELGWSLEYEIEQQQASICEQRFSQSYITLSEDAWLPELFNVQHFRIESNYRRVLAPATGPGIAASLPNVKNIWWLFDCNASNAVVVNQRVTFASSLCRLKVKHCREANIAFHSEWPEDQKRVPSSLLPGRMRYDPLSASLRVFSQNLTSLTVSGHLGAALFWPHSDEESTLPEWPYLRKLKVNFNMIAPSGEWYFTGTMPSSESSDDLTNHDNYREHGNPIALDPFLTAFTQALRTMPLIDRFVLESQLGWGKGYFLISYYAPGPYAEWYGDEPDDCDDPRVRRLFYTVGDVWRPDEVISKRLRDVGRERHGEGLLERFCGRWDWPSSD